MVACGSCLANRIPCPTAAFTIFVFGGAITEVARAYDVIEKKEKKEKKKKVAPPTDKDSCWNKFNSSFLLPWLTFPEEEHREESAPRFEYSMVHEPTPVEEDGGSMWNKAKAVTVALHMAKGASTREVKKNLNHEELQSMLGGVAAAKEVTIEDQIDELRIALPNLTSGGLRKLLVEADHNVHEAIIKGQQQGFS